MNIPDDLLYTSHDEWVRTEGDVVSVGISDFAQDQLGELVHVELPEVGTTVAAGDVVCEVESVKAVAEVYAPVAGTITAVNEAVGEDPSGINSDAYGSWIYKLQKSGEPEGLISPADYRAKLA